MHYHLEVIIPPVENIEEAINQILVEYNENYIDEDEDVNRYAFFDWWVIGGRWSGVKLEYLIDKEKKDKFYEELLKRGVMVSSIQAGKQELKPAAQIPAVDALWNEFFPDYPIKVCPLFAHFDNQYKSNTGLHNVMILKDTPKSLKTSHVIIAAPHRQNDNKLVVQYMIQDEMYNGVNFVQSSWNGHIFSAIDEYKKRLWNCNQEHIDRVTPQDDWLVVTVDYHS